MRVTLSVLGLYQHSPTLFDGLNVPQGMNKSLLVDQILMDTANLEVMYPNPVFLQGAIGNWSDRNQGVWAKLAATLNLEYNPIHNYDRTEEWVDDETRNLTGNEKETRNITGSDTETRNLKSSEMETRNLKMYSNVDSDVTSDTTSEGTSNTATNVSGYNNDALVPREEVDGKTTANDNVHGVTTTTNNTTDTGTVGTDGTNTGTVDHKRTDNDVRDLNKTDLETKKNNRTGRAFGNIGVTTTQQMIESEREVSKFNIYDYITGDFINRFCLEVY